MFHRHRLAALPKHLIWVKLALVLASLIPLAELFVDYLQNNLGFDPLDRITRTTGYVALVLLLVTLTITPLRYILTKLMVRARAAHGKRAADWNWIIRLRRIIGLLSFFYATLHLGIYFWLDQGADIADALRDMAERPFLAVGMLAFVLLVPLAVTANNYSLRRLGKNWRRLHRAVYVIAILAVLHFWMLTKVGVNDPVPFALVTSMLLGWRIWFALKRKKDRIFDNGMEMPERVSKSHYTGV